MRAYPRWRGGNLVASTPADRSEGLSPLARGKREAVLAGQGGVGPIPAGAGETCQVLFRLRVRGAYPRVTVHTPPAFSPLLHAKVLIRRTRGCG